MSTKTCYIFETVQVRNMVTADW